MRLPFLSRRHDRHRSRGQSLVEFALIIPVLLLLMMVALDFGRVYLGYINIQNVARIAANYAADHPTAWATNDTAVKSQYSNQIANDAKATNCTLPGTAPTPVFTDTGGNAITTDIGDTASVSITCTFRIATPVISNIVGSGGNLSVSASAVFPVKSGLTATSGGGGSAPTAAFTGTPTSGFSPLIVQFTDQSTGVPTSWAWDFNNDAIVDSTLRSPQFTFSGVGLYTVTLVATNANGSSTLQKVNYIAVNTAPATVNFTATPTSGVRPLTVQFTDTSTGSPTAWAWDFDNNGSVDSTAQNPSYTYNTAGTYTVSFTATNAGGPGTKTVPNMITVNVGTCIVPNFANTSSATAQATWNAASFTTAVQFQQGSLPWTITSQNQVVGQSLPCNTVITVSKN